jgi:hypothetical protein
MWIALRKSWVSLRRRRINEDRIGEHEHAQRVGWRLIFACAICALKKRLQAAALQSVLARKSNLPFL